MHTRTTTSGARRYLQLGEGYRTDERKVRHSVVADPARIHDLGPGRVDPLINMRQGSPGASADLPGTPEAKPP